MSGAAAGEREMTAPLIPTPDPNRVAPFWRAAAEGRLQFPRCRACGRFNWYPVPLCAACGGDAHGWTEVKAAPRIFSWAYARRALDPRLAPLVPYATVIVEFDDAHGVRLVTRLVEGEPDQLQIGRLGRIVFRDIGYPAAASGIVGPLLALPWRRSPCKPRQEHPTR